MIKFETGYDLDEEIYYIKFETESRDLFKAAEKALAFGTANALREEEENEE